MRGRGLVAFAALVAFGIAAQTRPAGEADPSRLGARLYAEHCAACHGAAGEGAPDWKRPNELGELPAPPHGPAGHTWRHSDAVLRRMIAAGWRDPFNKTSRLTMPAFEAVLTEGEIDAVIEYLKTLWTPEQRRYQANEDRKEP